MPLLHLPVVHKFGIISHSRRLELQERLVQAAMQDGKTKEGYQPKNSDAPRTHQIGEIAAAVPCLYIWNPFEVTDEFIKKFNSAEAATEKAACEAEAQRLLARVRRRTGLRDGGVGPHVNLPFAWTELVFLAHCRGRVHQDALDALLISLEQAPVGYYQIPALFYIAETVLYWLQSESTSSDALRSAEVKTLKVGQLTFLRLFYHHMTGQLRRHGEARSRLGVYLREFHQLEPLYSSYPDVALCHGFIAAVGRVVAAEGAAGSEPATAATAEPEESGGGAGASPDLRSLVTAEVHDLSPVLWHALDVWRCARHLGGDLEGALDGLLTCAVTMAQGNWIDAYLALLIVGNAACEDVECLRIFIELGIDREVFVTEKERFDSESAGTRLRSDTGATSTEESYVISALSKQSTGVAPSGSQGQDASAATTTFPVMSSSVLDNHRPDGNSGPSEAEGDGLLRRQPAQEAEPGRHLVGMATWRWELAAGYIQQLARICLDAAVSSARQRALADSRCSLTALATRRIDTDDASDAAETCWRIRYLALQGLQVVAKTTDGDDLRRCLRDAAWPAIEQCQRRERVPQVLGGQPLAAVWADLSRLADRTRPGALSGLAGHLAYALTMIYLPALPPPVRLKPAGVVQLQQQQPSTTTQRRHQSKPAPTPAVDGPPRRQQLQQQQQRTTLRQEIRLAEANIKPAVDYETRRTYDLRRVVEDQWRKQAQSHLELDNATRETRLRVAAEATTDT